MLIVVLVIVTAQAICQCVVEVYAFKEKLAVVVKVDVALIRVVNLKQEQEDVAIRSAQNLGLVLYVTLSFANHKKRRLVVALHLLVAM
jgi:hypothetical protein